MSRKLIAHVLIWSLQWAALSPSLAQQSPPQPDLTAALEANARAVLTVASPTEAKKVLPEYTDNPPEAQHAGKTLTELQGAAQGRIASCATKPNDPVCQGERAGRAANAAPRMDLGATAADVGAAQESVRNPAGTLGSISDYYKGCSADGSCASSVFCFGTSCFDTTTVNDTDFAQTMSYMEAARQAGVYLDPNSLTVFNGEDSRCTSNAFNDCCDSDPKGGTMSNGQSMGKGSKFVFDMLMNSNNRAFLMAGMKAMATGAGFSGSMTFSGVTFAVNGAAVNPALTTLYQGQGVVIAVDPMSLAIMVVVMIIMRMMSCDETDMKTALKEGAKLCVTVPPTERCISRVLGICKRWETTKCCFNSVLARIINQQDRAQLGMNWGSNQSPSCTGFTVAQLQSLDFAAMDMSEFYASLQPAQGDVPGWAAAAQEKAPQCYYGEGKCNPATLPPAQPGK